METEFVYMGVKYPSRTYVSKTFDIRNNSIEQRIKHNLPFDINSIKTIKNFSRGIELISFKNEKIMREKFKIKESTFTLRISEGYTVEESLLKTFNFNNIKTLRKIRYKKTLEDLQFAKSLDTNDKKYLANLGIMHKKLYCDPDPDVRAAVASYGHFMYKLSEDKDERVLMQVITNTNNLTKFITHPNWKIRKEVAKRGVGLETLKRDKTYQVKIEVIKQNYALNELLNDPMWRVRLSAKKQIEDFAKP